MTPRTQNLKWLVCYSGELTVAAFKDVDWAIVDQDVDPKPLKNEHTKFIAYMSVGEAEEGRDYWPLIKDSRALVEKNKNWRGAHLVDVRVAEWRQILFSHVLPKIRSKGFDGVFLDTVDVPIYLEEKDARRFSGSRQALVDFVRELRRQYPGFLIVPNNGLPVLTELSADVDAVLVEALYTNYDFNKKRSVRTEDDVFAGKEKYLDAFRARTGKPVLNLLYETSSDTPLARFAIKRSREKGYAWYLTTVDLMKIGVVDE